MHRFSEFKEKFDREFGAKKEFDCFLPVNETIGAKAKIKDSTGKPSEDYYKWQLLYALVNSGMYSKDYIGTEVYFPKGNKSSAPIKFDAAIFDDKDWFEHYQRWRKTKDQAELDWLRQHLIAAIEIKREDGKQVEAVYNQQLKPAIKESERDFCLGVLYDAERLYLFRKQGNKVLRLSDDFNAKGDASTTKELSLHLPETYRNIPSFEELENWISPKSIDRSKLTVTDLDRVTGIRSKQINTAMSNILRTMDTNGMVNQNGYEILIQILSLKIFDEKKNEAGTKKYLDFYITDSEAGYADLNDPKLQPFLQRIDKLRRKATGEYYRILQNNLLDLKNAAHVAVLVEVTKQLQDYSFVLSHKTDLYQIVFYSFAQEFSKQRNAQFVTPLPIINFLVNIVNPRNGETVIDPTVGIADFLSVSYVNSNSRLSDENIYGVDIDPQMIMLASLNMLLNGDGNAKLKSETTQGSITNKFDNRGDLLQLVPHLNRNGAWEKRNDGKQLMKFDVVLTNPPFGEDRAWRPTEIEKEYAECYELWNIARAGDWIDKGLIFLENAYRILDEKGRFGIVLSNSLASIERWQRAREWLLERVRVVAIFDLPANVFTETGVNTTLIVGYKPTDKELSKLKTQGYSVFMKDIRKVGYEVRTSKRVKVFEPTYKVDYKTFDIEIDSEGSAVLDEEFTQTVKEFREWANGQEASLQDLFVKAK